MCAIFVLLLKSTYTVKQKRLTIFYVSTATVFISTVTSINYHWMLQDITSDNIKLIYINSAISNISLIITFIMFCLYIENIVNMDKKYKNIFNAVLVIYFVFYVIVEISAPYTHMGLYIDDNKNIHADSIMNIFIVGYILFAIISCSIVLIYRKRLGILISRELCGFRLI